MYRVPEPEAPRTPPGVVLGGVEAHGDHAAFAVADDGNPARVDIVALVEPFDDGEEVVGVVGLGDGFASAAALADGALVVADDEKSLLRQGAGELAQYRDAGNGAVAIERARVRHEHDGWVPQPSKDRRHRDCAGDAEAIGRNGHVGVGRVPCGQCSGGDTGKVVSNNAQAVGRHIEPGEPSPAIDGHGHRERRARAVHTRSSYFVS